MYLIFKGFVLVIVLAWGIVFPASAIELKSNTFVSLVLQQNLNSKDLELGDVVRFRVGPDVVVGNTVVIESGAVAISQVTAIDKHGMIGKGGSITLTVSEVVAVDGQSIHLLGQKTVKGDDETTGTVVVGVVLCPLALLNNGDAASAGEGLRVRAVVAGNYEIQI